MAPAQDQSGPYWPDFSLTRVQIAYGAMILSFLGGPHWGYGMTAGSSGAIRLLWGVTPSLIAWPAVLVPEPLGIDILSAGLISALTVDTILFGFKAPLYLTLRIPLTVVAVASLQSNNENGEVYGELKKLAGL